ncbi:MAG: sulfatase-like hydrolase/transferase, partial [Verrucomicrobiales bacterium]|nr:sulfatase-like hydrolase/transferase [Verrucomicrobiales bacterium]
MNSRRFMSSLKLPKSRTSKIFVLVVCLAFTATTQTPAAPTTPPNIIMLLVDDMGYADVGCMGAKDIKTPNIDRIAAEGVRMTDFYANAPVCSPTRAAFITGRWQQRCGIEWAIGLTSEEEKRVNGELVPVAERFTMGLMPEDTFLVPLLKKHGYGTACYGKWHLGFK